MSDIQIGIIGGSGLYEMEGLKVLYERTLETPFGAPSDPYVIGEGDGVKVAFLAPDRPCSRSSRRASSASPRPK